MLVEGEAGIGKSRLVDEFVATGGEPARRVLAGACLPFADAVPYAPLAQILAAPGGRRRRAAPVHGAEPIDRFRFFQWVADRSSPRPRSSRRGRRRGPPLGRRVDRRPAAVRRQRRACSAGRRRRDPPPARARRVERPGRRARRAGAVGAGERSELGPLADDEVGELIGQIIGVEPSRGLLDRVVARAEGNPFFVEELVAAGGGADLPTTVGDLVLQRVARIDPQTRQLLRVAAVIGRRVGYALLREVAGVDSTAIDARSARGGGPQLMVRGGDHYSFRHALGHEAVYGDLLPGERAALHERVAVCLAAHPELALGDDPALAAASWPTTGTPPAACPSRWRPRCGPAGPPSSPTPRSRPRSTTAVRSSCGRGSTDAAAVAGIDRPWLLEHAAEVASLAGSHHGAVQLADQLRRRARRRPRAGAPRPHPRPPGAVLVARRRPHDVEAGDRGACATGSSRA